MAQDEYWKQNPEEYKAHLEREKTNAENMKIMKAKIEQERLERIRKKELEEEQRRMVYEKFRDKQRK